MDKRDIAIVVLATTTARRMLTTTTEIEVKLYEVMDEDATRTKITGDDFDSELGQLVQQNTQISTVTVCCASSPQTVSSFSSPVSPDTDSEDQKSAGALAIVLPLLFCLCCIGGGYYFYTNNKKLWEMKEDVNEETGV